MRRLLLLSTVALAASSAFAKGYISPKAYIYDCLTDFSCSSQAKIVDNIGTIISIVNVNNNAPAEYFNLQGVKINNPEKGVYIVKKGNTVTNQVF